MSSSTFSVRIDSRLRKEAEKYLSEMGLNMSAAINIYLHQIVRHKAIPFAVSAAPMPADETLAAMAEGERIAQDSTVPGYRDMDSLHRALES